jgi:hypothetical protein
VDPRAHNHVKQLSPLKLRLDTPRVRDIYKIATKGGKISSNTISCGVPLKLGSKVLRTIYNLGLRWDRCHSWDGLDDSA